MTPVVLHNNNNNDELLIITVTLQKPTKVRSRHQHPLKKLFFSLTDFVCMWNVPQWWDFGFLY